EVSHSAYRGDVGLRRGEAAAICLDRANRLVDVRDRNRTLEPDHLLSTRELATFLQRASDRAARLLPGVDQVEAWWSPWFEAPVEDRLVERASPWDIVSIDCEEIDVVSHGRDCTPPAPRRLALD